MSYFEWVEHFQNLKNSPMDEDLLKKVENKNLDGGDYVLQHLVEHIINTVNTRLNNSFNLCLDKIYTSGIDINNLSLDLVNFKKERAYVKKIIDFPIINKEIKQTFIASIDRTFNDMCNVLRSNIQYIDINGEHISNFDKIIFSKMEE